MKTFYAWVGRAAIVVGLFCAGFLVGGGGILKESRIETVSVRMAPTYDVVALDEAAQRKIEANEIPQSRKVLICTYGRVSGMDFKNVSWASEWEEDPEAEDALSVSDGFRAGRIRSDPRHWHPWYGVIEYRGKIECSPLSTGPNYESVGMGAWRAALAKANPRNGM